MQVILMPKFIYSIAFMLLFIFNSNGQQSPSINNQIDSLKQIIRDDKNDTLVLNAYKAWDDLIYISEPDLDYNLTKKIVSISQNALKKKNLSKKEKLALQKALAFGYTNFGIISKGKGNNAKAIEYYLKSLRINEKINNQHGIAGSLNNIGIVYYDQKNFNKAMDYYTKSLIIEEKIGDEYGASQSLNNIGIIYGDQQKWKKAMYYYNRSLKLKEKLGNKSEIALALNNIGVIYRDLKQFDKALEYNLRSLAIQEEIGDKSGIAQSYNNLANVYSVLGDYPKAIEFGHKALKIAREINNAVELAEIYASLYQSNKKAGRFEESLIMHELFMAKRDSLEDMESQKEILNAEVQYEYEKRKAIDAKEREKELAITSAHEQKQLIITWSIGIGLLLVIIFALFVVSRLRVTHKQKRIIEKQKHLVEEKQKEIYDSIHYAKRIQLSQMPTEKYIARQLARNRGSKPRD